MQHHNSLDGSEDDFVFGSSSDDKSFVEVEALLDKLFASDLESKEFYRFWGIGEQCCKIIAHFEAVENNYFVI